MSIFKDFDFKQLSSIEFKEDSVREVIILPALYALGYKENEIKRSKKLSHPHVSIGSKQEKISIYPDYLLYKNENISLVLDAKAPSENIRDGKNVGQAYSYAIHPDIRSKKYALCNGHEWTFYTVDNTTPILTIATERIDEHWKDITEFLFSEKKEPVVELEKKDDEWYMSKTLPRIIGKPTKRNTKRHFGVHGYFTRQSWDIVDEHIRHFTEKGDAVLDSFGGTGVTFTEALMNGRIGNHIDLNPLSVFWATVMTSKVDLVKLGQTGDEIIKTYKKNIDKIISKDVEKYFPKDLPLPKDADVPTLHGLFSDNQMIELAYLKSLILKVKDKNLQQCLLFAFSSSVSKHNLTYHSSSQGGDDKDTGDNSAFRYYRFRLAPKPFVRDLDDIFETKLKNLIKGKGETKNIDDNLLAQSRIIRGDATNLKDFKDLSIDYIYTDPPYGKKIQYLDLSSMWNAWLDFEVSEEDREKEAIEGGTLEKTRDSYTELIIKSIQEMFRVLKYNRWMSFVFQHQDPYYWYLIVNNAEKIGFEYAGVTKQNNGQTSFKKRKSPFTVLAGQLIIHFKKVKSPKAMIRQALGADIGDIIQNEIESVIAEKDGATLEDIYDRLITNGLEMGFLDELSKYKDMTPYLNQNFELDDETKKYHIRKNAKFKAHIDARVRIRYFLISYLRRKNRENIYPTFDDIVLDIIPLLKNGTTPESQTILSVLESIARKRGDGWVFLEGNDLSFF